MNYYYQDSKFNLIKDDCIKIMKMFEDKTFDMIFADPPYFLSNDGITCSRWKNGDSK